MRKNMKKLIQNEEMKAAKKEIMGCQKRLPLEKEHVAIATHGIGPNGCNWPK